MLCVGAMMMLFDIIFFLGALAVVSANDEGKKINKQKCDIEINVNAIETQFSFSFRRAAVEAFFCALIVSQTTATAGSESVHVDVSDSSRKTLNMKNSQIDDP